MEERPRHGYGAPAQCPKLRQCLEGLQIHTSPQKYLHPSFRGDFVVSGSSVQEPVLSSWKYNRATGVKRESQTLRAHPTPSRSGHTAKKQLIAGAPALLFLHRSQTLAFCCHIPLLPWA